jgi:hypothetical protein
MSCDALLDEDSFAALLAEDVGLLRLELLDFS